jgi:hypothetical protein
MQEKFCDAVKTRPFWIVSLVSILSAIILHLSALGAAAKHVESFTKSIKASEPQKQQLKIEAKKFSHESDLLVASGWLAGTVALVALIVSRRREEPTSPFILFLLLTIYVVLQFAIV